MRRWVRAAVVLLVAPLVCLACGGGGDTPVTVTITSTDTVRLSVERRDPQCQFRLRFPVASDLALEPDQVLFGGGSPDAFFNDQATLTITYVH